MPQAIFYLLKGEPEWDNQMETQSESRIGTGLT